MIAACDAARSAEKDSEGATSETENDFDVSAEVSKIERVHEQQEADIKLAHELANDADRMSAFDAPLSPNISHFSSSGPDTHSGVGAFASDVHHTSRTQPRVHISLSTCL